MTNYVYDPIGTLPANLIIGETHSVTEANFRDYYLIIPTYAPFFINNLTVHLTVNNVTSLLVEGVDYSLVLFYLAATRSLGIPVYGAISLNNTNVSGQITVNYQTIGNPYIADKQQVLAALATYTYNPRITTWDLITNVQEIWPPNDHNQDASTLDGMFELVTAINNLITTIGVSNSSIPQYINFITNPNNPTNVTASQVGLGLVQNLPLATNNQILNEIPANAYVTLSQVLQLLSQASYITAQLGLKHLAFLDKADLTLNVSNVLPPSNGGLGSIDLQGFLYGNGVNPATAFTIIPTVNGGLGASNLTGYLYGNGNNPAIGKIPLADKLILSCSSVSLNPGLPINTTGVYDDGLRLYSQFQVPATDVGYDIYNAFTNSTGSIGFYYTIQTNGNYNVLFSIQLETINSGISEPITFSVVVMSNRYNTIGSVTSTELAKFDLNIPIINTPNILSFFSDSRVKHFNSGDVITVGLVNTPSNLTGENLKIETGFQITQLQAPIS